MSYHEMFSYQRIALQQELTHHPELCELLAKIPAAEFEMRLAEISAYAGVLLDGYYTQGELDKLCDILTRKLVEKRTQLILSW